MAAGSGGMGAGMGVGALLLPQGSENVHQKVPLEQVWESGGTLTWWGTGVDLDARTKKGMWLNAGQAVLGPGVIWQGQSVGVRKQSLECVFVVRPLFCSPEGCNGFSAEE